MKIVFVSSPYAPTNGMTVEENVSFARKCVKGLIDDGYCPIAPHLIYPFVLDDNDQDQREKGMKLAKELLHKCDFVCFFVDNGFSSGMKEEKDYAEKLKISTVTVRNLK